jgi:hypothetical protein
LRQLGGGDGQQRHARLAKNLLEFGRHVAGQQLCNIERLGAQRVGHLLPLLIGEHRHADLDAAKPQFTVLHLRRQQARRHFQPFYAAAAQADAVVG